MSLETNALAAQAKPGWPRRVYRKYSFQIFLVRQNPLTMLGIVIVFGLLLIAALAPWITPYDPLVLDPINRMQAPSAAHWFGTDDFGRDILSRVIAASRIDLTIALSSVCIAFAVGVSLGAIAGYFRGLADEAIMRVMDIIQSFPSFILAMGLAAALGAGMTNIIYVVSFIMLPIFARLVRSEMLSVRERPYAEAARCAGASNAAIIFSHLLPNCAMPVIVQFALSLSYAILDTAGLSFVGLGVKPPEAEWGSMISEGVRYVASGQWWNSFFPGAAIFIAILGFNLFADGLRDILDPKLRS